MSYIRAFGGRCAAVMVLLCVALGPVAAEEWTYTARRGDNLWLLAEEFLVSMRHWQEFRALNDVPNPRHMQPGTTIRFPARWLRVQPAAVEIIAVSGHAVTRDASGAEAPARPGAKLGSGASVATPEDASVVLRFADGSQMLVRPGTEVRMDDLSVYGRHRPVVDSRARLQRGRVEVDVPPGQNNRLEITTPSASALVRGTRFRVGSEEAISRAEVVAGGVRVSGETGNITVPAGNGTVVRAGEPPAPPRALLPAPDLTPVPALIQRRQVRIGWQGVPGAAGYRAQIATPGAVPTLLLDVPTDTARLQLPDLPDGRYVLHVRGVDDLGLEGIDAALPIELDARPEPPATLEPRPDATVRVKVPSFRWSEPVDAVRYRLQVAAGPAFESPIIDRGGLTDTRFEADSELEPGSYSWRVASVDDTGEQGPYSDVQTFTIRPAPPAPAGAGATVGEKDVLLRWQSAQPGQTYEVEMADSENFASGVRRQDVTEPQLVLPVPERDLWFRVRTVDTDGYRGPFGTPNRIEVPQEQPWWLLAVPVLLLLL